MFSFENYTFLANLVVFNKKICSNLKNFLHTTYIFISIRKIQSQPPPMLNNQRARFIQKYNCPTFPFFLIRLTVTSVSLRLTYYIYFFYIMQHACFLGRQNDLNVSQTLHISQNLTNSCKILFFLKIIGIYETRHSRNIYFQESLFF